MRLETIVKDNPFDSVKAAYLMLSSLNYLIKEHGDQNNMEEATNIIDSLFFDSIELIEQKIEEQRTQKKD